MATDRPVDYRGHVITIVPATICSSQVVAVVDRASGGKTERVHKTAATSGPGKSKWVMAQAKVWIDRNAPKDGVTA